VPIGRKVTERLAGEGYFVYAGARGLYCMVNNAGIGSAGSVIGGNDSEFELAMNVNALGPYRITKAFGPLVIQSKGRIVNIGSVS
jgi:NAD(P)-dependent dehydrogenase (short-subunit alcohol dehydrogenase family)